MRIYLTFRDSEPRRFHYVLQRSALMLGSRTTELTFGLNKQVDSEPPKPGSAPHQRFFQRWVPQMYQRTRSLPDTGGAAPFPERARSGPGARGRRVQQRRAHAPHAPAARRLPTRARLGPTEPNDPGPAGGGGAHTRTPSALRLSTEGTLADSARQWQRMLRRGGSERAARTLHREPRALTPAGFLRALCAATAWT